jgi:hypothetical protein
MNVEKLLKALIALTASAMFIYGAQAFADHHEGHGTAPAKASKKAGRKAADAGTATVDGGSAAVVPAGKARTVELRVTEKGYEPSPIKLKKGEPVRLVVTRTTEQTCATEIILDKTDINVPLPLNKPVEIAFTPKDSGELKYGCHMGKMISGVFLVD